MSAAEILEEVLGQIDRCVADADQQMESLLRDRAPKDTGATANYLRVTKTGRFEWTARSVTEGGFYSDTGTKPHVIVPKNKKSLFWEGPTGPVFAQRVNHPGSMKHKGWFSEAELLQFLEGC